MEFVCRQQSFDAATQTAVCDKLVSNCLWNFREVLRRVRPADFAVQVRDMRSKLRQTFDAEIPLLPPTRKRLRRIVRRWGWYYLTHFALRKRARK